MACQERQPLFRDDIRKGAPLSSEPPRSCLIAAHHQEAFPRGRGGNAVSRAHPQDPTPGHGSARHERVRGAGALQGRVWVEELGESRNSENKGPRVCL